MSKQRNAPGGEPGAASGTEHGAGKNGRNAGLTGHYSTDGQETLEAIEALSQQAKVQPAEPDPAQILLGEQVSDEGNAQAVHKLYRGCFLFNPAFGWMHHTGTHWTKESADAAVDRAIVQTLIDRASAALHSGQAEQHDRLIKFCIPNKARVQGAQYLLSSLAISAPGEFASEPDFLNCPNGVVDLRTGDLHAHTPAQRFMHCTTVPYLPDTNSRRWESWLLEAVGGDPDMVDWLQLGIGYSLTGHTREEILFYLHGPERAGKGLFLETLQALLGSELAKEVNFGTFTAERTGDSQNFDLAPLKACRLVAASESNKYERFNEAKVKALTGGNEVYCAFKHRTHFNYRPQFKIWLSSNEPVNADPDDDAVWGRLRVIEFPHSHLGREDKLLKQRMKEPANLQGVLAWAVSGAIHWYQLGSAGLPELESSAKLKAKQRADLDNVGAWIEESCEEGEHFFAGSANLYRSYKSFCTDNGVPPKQQRGFAEALKRKGYRADRQRVDSRLTRGFYGLQVMKV